MSILQPRIYQEAKGTKENKTAVGIDVLGRAPIAKPAP
jgi:hypothetical protein